MERECYKDNDVIATPGVALLFFLEGDSIVGVSFSHDERLVCLIQHFSFLACVFLFFFFYKDTMNYYCKLCSVCGV